jgi:hypothetical protein
MVKTPTKKVHRPSTTGDWTPGWHIKTKQAKKNTNSTDSSIDVEFFYFLLGEIMNTPPRANGPGHVCISRQGQY